MSEANKQGILESVQWLAATGILHQLVREELAPALAHILDEPLRAKLSALEKQNALRDAVVEAAKKLVAAGVANDSLAEGYIDAMDDLVEAVRALREEKDG